MNTIPLVKGNTQEEINTSLIALKKALDEMNSSSSKTDASVQLKIKQINELITNINSQLDTIDGQITDLQPVNSVTSGNMHSVTSNAVSRAMSYSTSEVNTGKKWIDGKPIYRKVINVNSNPAIIQTGLTSANEVINVIIKNTVGGTSNNFVFNGCLNDFNVYYPWLYELSPDNTTLSRITGTYSGTVKFVILEYTKTN